jgi:F-type H+-transporting ATPase subunit a
MVTHEAWLTKLFNEYFAGLAIWLLNLFHLKPEDPAEPWADFMVMQILVTVVLIVVFAILRGRLSVAKPGAMQQVFEVIHGFVQDETKGQIEHGSHRHVPLFETLFIFLIFSNLLGIIPGFMSPTQVIYVPAGCALLSFVYFNWVGMRKQGVLKYAKHFMGPIWWLAPLMIPIEIAGTLARLLSLSVRLFANMYAGDQVTMVFLSLTYVVVPAVFMGLHVFVGLLQAYIFVLLTMIYVAGAVAEEH